MGGQKPHRNTQGLWGGHARPVGGDQSYLIQLGQQ